MYAVYIQKIKDQQLIIVNQQTEFALPGFHNSLCAELVN